VPVITANGDPVKIAGPGDARKEYEFRCEGNSVLLGRRKQSVADTASPRRRLRKGDRGTIDREEGEEIWAFNDDLAGDGSDARLDLQQAGFYVNFGTRPVVGAVDTGRDAEAPAASDEYVHRYATGADPSAGVVESFRTPNAAETVAVSVDDADDSFEVAVVFTDADGNEITRRDSGNSGDYSGNSTTDVFLETVIASDYVSVEITGAATSADYTVYAR